MSTKELRSYLETLLSGADIHINGTNPWDIKIHNDEVFPRVIRYGSLGLGESYVDKWWDCNRLDQFFELLLKASIKNKIRINKLSQIKLILPIFLNFQTKKRALEVGERHYDLGNSLFQLMLDSRMNYTEGYWKAAENLDDAQRNKLELVCQKLQLKPGMHLLDVGCGFGALSKYAAENYGVSVVGITISKEQCNYAKKNCANLPVEIRFQDYRDLKGKFDRIASLGMFEHVGLKNYRVYMQIIHQCLQDDGLFLLGTIGNIASHVTGNEWLNKYIFPNGMLPSITQIGRATEGLLIMEEWHNYPEDYDKTLMAWYSNFNKHWEELKTHYDERFYRMWNYYLLSCAGAFRAHYMQLWQILFSKQIQ
jgi:cyclopropane-fatty-acyl-phospholipid synthase